LSLTTSVSKEGMWLSAKSMSSFFFFWLRHLFQYQRADQFILTPQNFNRVIYGQFLTWNHKGLLWGGHRRPSPILTLLL
jgi:hypothetical protein